MSLARLACISLIFTFPLAAQRPGGAAAGAVANPTPGRTPGIEERTAGMQKIDGFFPIYWDERTGNLWLEISRFDADFLLFTALHIFSRNMQNTIGIDQKPDLNAGQSRAHGRNPFQIEAGQ